MSEEVKALNEKITRLERDKAELLRLISRLADDPSLISKWRGELVRRSRAGEDYISFAEWADIAREATNA